jgi:predicted DNA-binding protein (MmcQ/YjbR family)
MDIEHYRELCLSLPHVTEDMPFDENVLVFRIGGKIFTLLDINDFESVNLKCDPERAIELREQHAGIQPGYHMNKKHWNTVRTDGSVDDRLIVELVKHSYDLVFKSLPLSKRKELSNR